MPDRHLPVRLDLDQLRRQAKELLRALRRGDPPARAAFARHHPVAGRDPASARLSDAQLVLARSYGVAGWPRLSLACRLIEAIWRDDVDAVRALVARHPKLLREAARGVPDSSWGPPLTYAANLGRDRVIEALHQLGASDLGSALGRAVLQGQIGTARKLMAMGALPPDGRLPADALLGPAETLNADGLAFLFELGAVVSERRAEAALVLETYTRDPEGKHRCLELLARNGVPLPDTPPMAVHRGRVDLLEAHLRRRPDLLHATFPHAEIFPAEAGCHVPENAMVGAPLEGATLLHMCVEWGELDLARFLLGRGIPPDVRAAVDETGFGGHTALYGCVVSFPYLCGRERDAALTRLLFERGASPSPRASLRVFTGAGAERAPREFRDVTPISWGDRYPERGLVNRAAMKLIAERGGT